jgi:hypothetical protein
MTTVSYSFATIPGNSQYLVVWDTTWGLNLPAAAAAEPVPGPHRGRWAKFRRVLVTVKNGDQAVTVVFRKMSNPTLTTASAWETDGSGPGSGSATLNSGTTTTYNWLLPTPDSRVYVLAGANNPDAMVTTVIAHCDASAGV